MAQQGIQGLDVSQEKPKEPEKPKQKSKFDIEKNINIVCNHKRMPINGKYLILSNKFINIYEADKNITEWDLTNHMTPDMSEYITTYLEYHKGNKPKEINKPLHSIKLEHLVDIWDTKFINAFDYHTLLKLLNAAIYTDINSLIQLCCAKIVVLIKTKDHREILRMFS